MTNTNLAPGLLLAVALAVPVVTLAAPPADTVALNGKIYTMNEKQPWAEA